MVEINPIFEAVAREDGFYERGTDGASCHGRHPRLYYPRESPKKFGRVFRVCPRHNAPIWHMRYAGGIPRSIATRRSPRPSISRTNATTQTTWRRSTGWPSEIAIAKVSPFIADGCRKYQPMALKETATRPKHGNQATESTASQIGTSQAAFQPATSCRKSQSRHSHVRQLTPFGNMHINITVDPQDRPRAGSIRPARKRWRSGQQ